MQRISLLLLCTLFAVTCYAQNNPILGYWQETVVNHCFGKEYISFRVNEVVTTRYKEELSDNVVVKDPIYIASGPGYLCSDNGFDRVMMAADSLFVDFYLDGNFYYGSINNLATEFERNIAEGLVSRMERGLYNIMPFYLLPRHKQSFDLPFVDISDCGDGSHMLKYTYPAIFAGAEGIDRHRVVVG